MLKVFEYLFGTQHNPDFKTLVEHGAIILDVRTKTEYEEGHIPGSQNIPLDQLESSMQALDKNRPIITCCVTGMRSESAKRTLKANGFLDVYNAGNWTNLQKYIQE